MGEPAVFIRSAEVHDPVASKCFKVRKQYSIQWRRFHARMSRGPLMAVSRHIM
jgi:hypothetical protein